VDRASIIVDDGSTIEGEEEDRADGNTREDIFKGIFIMIRGGLQ